MRSTLPSDLQMPPRLSHVEDRGGFFVPRLEPERSANDRRSQSQSSPPFIGAYRFSCVYGRLGQHSEGRKPTRPYLTLGIVSQALTGSTARRETLSSDLTLKDQPKESQRDIAFADPSPRFPTNHAPLSRHGTTSRPGQNWTSLIVIPARRLRRPEGGTPHPVVGIKNTGSD